MATSITNTSVNTDNITIDTNVLHVDSTNNRVGIGTASPSRQAMISRSIADGSGELGIVSSDSSTSGALGNIHFGNSVDSSLASIRATADGATDAGKLEFRTEKTGVAIETAMGINSNGQITKPNQPAFSISGGPNSYRDGSNNETVILHGQSGSFPGDMNIGGHFSYSNGRFTAPVAGNYMFTYTLTSNDTNAHFIELRKNNSSQTTVLLYTTQYQSGCHSTIYTLAANDYITAQRRGTGYGVYSAVFSGFLIG